MKNNPFSFFINQLEDNLPESLRPFQAEVKETARKILQDKFSEFNLVAREEWAQQEVLLKKTEARIAELEARLQKLESK